MSNNVNVSLDTTVDPPALKVHDHGHIKVAKKSTPQTISWNLTGTIAAGSFVAMDADPPGFRWVGEPLGTDPARTVVIEDSGNGILSGLNAGMPVVAIPRPFLAPAADVLARASAVLGSLDELTVDLVQGLGAGAGVR